MTLIPILFFQKKIFLINLGRVSKKMKDNLIRFQSEIFIYFILVSFQRWLLYNIYQKKKKKTYKFFFQHFICLEIQLL
jgi:hypothetical protein